MKKILAIYSAPNQHWVGNGFPVRSLFSYDNQENHLSPFLMLDYAGPTVFEPATQSRGVGQHPHRGFETVTIVYQGELEHSDSTGSSGVIGEGDVQWMTAASGILHEEYHSQAFTRSGGTLEMVQLWVNLPAKYKMSPPGYQTLLNQAIPTIALPESAGTLRIIAGDYDANQGAAKTYTPIDVWDMRLNPGGSVQLDFQSGRTLAVVVLSGTVMVNDSEVVRSAQMVVFDREAGQVSIEANNDAKLLILGGEPIDEPIVGQGPFVMNSQADINQAFDDFNSGQFIQAANVV